MCGHDTGQAEERYRGVVRVDGHEHAHLLRHGHHTAKEVVQVLLDVSVRKPPVVVQRLPEVRKPCF